MASCHISVKKKKKQNNLTVVVKLPSSWLSSHRCRWSSVKSQPLPITLNGDPSHSFEPATIRLPDDPSHSFESATLRLPSNRQPFDFPATLRIPLNRRPFTFPTTVRLPSNRRPFVTKSSISSRWPFAFLPSGPLSLSLSKFFQFFLVLIFLLINPREIWLMCIFVSTNIHRQRDILLLLLLLGFLIHLQFWLFYLSFLVLVILVFIYLPFCSVWFLRNCKRTVITPKLFPLFNLLFFFFCFVFNIFAIMLCLVS